ncbi:phloem protein 2-B4 [Arabidopsis thaliana]|uniref:Putative protein PHLOEM PROTEIN 2-LIKE B4 n=1 Tax=Arabidopsis thaliana TaxID=3702 RepID=PP2B4_ARATH|nr:phloem protein 2-B4 [Arabidopsis thaliana]Q9ZVR3.1 RecName: Full=Putative protein PHLOEM PROTEIN 2-LIKE B4; Short=AtPP2-B4 [Arabidopsis thaliana]AAC78511.1 putative phloem-specific lectin [Arabidopsis thaliana]AEC05562.1 phloem protein 2-B4 [Arabidopsis thaliana]|eukprot:NP_178334.1 phloem protein 2-B4 [Arabidopsis thaliana]
MNTQILSQKTRYSAYIVYKTIYRFHGFKHIGVGFIGHGTPKAKRWERKDLGNDWLGCKKKFKASKKQKFYSNKSTFTDKPITHLIKLEEGEDGWMATEFGEFFAEGGGLLDCDEIVLSVIDIDYAYWKCGLIIQGIDIRPTKSP